MATDRESTFSVRFDGDGSALKAVLAGLKSQIKSDVADIEATTARVQLFQGLQDNVKSAGDAVLKARDAVSALQQQIDKLNGAGSKPTADLARAMADAEKQVVSLSRQYNSQSDALDKMRTKLAAAGVDTNNLAAEELRLSAALKTAQTQATLNSSKDLLGFKSLQDVTPQITALRTAFTNLQTSGTLSAKEIAAAQVVLNQRIAEVNSTVSTTGGLFQSAFGDGGALVSSLTTRFLAPIAIISALTAAVKGASDTTETFNKDLALIGSITNLSAGQLADLGEKVKALASSIGFDLDAGLKGLYELIRTGVPPDNALEVLKISAEAAHASLSDVSDGLKAAQLLMSAAGVPAAQLGTAFDVLVQAAKDGGPTLAEFAANAGPVLNIAKAMNIPLNELVATITVMTRATGDSAGSMEKLQQILTKLDTAAARQKLRDLGIEGSDLVGIFKQLSEKGISLQELTNLGLVSTKSAAGIASLVNSAHALPAELDRLNNSAGATAAGLKKFFDTPQGAAAAFDAQLTQAGISIGDITGKASVLGQTATLLLRGFNALTAQNEGFTAALKLARGETEQSVPALAAAAAGQTALAAATAKSAAAQAQAAADIKTAHQDLTQYGADLIKQTADLSAALASDVKDIDARAQAQIAALDRGKAAEAATAAATLQIDLKAAADRLLVITKAEKDITDAVDTANAAREKVERDEGQSEQTIASESAKARIAALAPVLAQYEQHYATLINLAQTYSAKAEAAEQARVEIAKTVAEAIRQVQLSELDGLDQYAAKQQHVDELVSEARQKAAQGDIAAAKTYFDQAIAESNGLTQVVDANGVVIVTQLQARTDKLAKLKEIADASNQSIGDQGKAATAGANAAIAAADRVKAKILDLQATYDGLKATMAAGLVAKVNLDEQSVAAATAALNQLTKPRQVNVTVNYIPGTAPGAAPGITGATTLLPGPWDASGSGAANGPVNVFARGGFVPPPTFWNEAPPLASVLDRSNSAAVRSALASFAAGGPVFTGTRVPGTGDADSFFTTLAGGSFVVRKAAAAHYGDAIMRGIAGFAGGGPVVDPNAPIPTYFQNFYNAAQTAQGKGPAGLGAFGDTASFQSFGDPTLPSNFNDLVAATFSYVASVRGHLAIDKPGTWDLTVAALNDAIAQFQLTQRPDDLSTVIAFARTIGLNLGYSVGAHAGFDIDGRRWHAVAAQPFGSLPHSIGSVDDPGAYFDYKFYTKGGPTSDTVAAMLAPGEFVIRKSAVDNLGVGLLNAINTMRVPKFDLAAAFAPPQRPQRFAEGGYVGAMPANAGGAPALGAPTINVTVNANAQDLFSRDNVYRFLVPVLQDFMRKSQL